MRRTRGLVTLATSEAWRRPRSIACLDLRHRSPHPVVFATEVRARFFDKGLKLPARAVEQLQGKEPGQ